MSAQFESSYLTSPYGAVTLTSLFRRLLREQWIRAKYEREEFLSVERQEPYSAGEGRVRLSLQVAKPLNPPQRRLSGVGERSVL